MNALRKIAGKPKYYFIFPIVVATLFSTSLIQVACPVCGGTGTLAYSVGMENVRIVSLETRIISSKVDACTAYILTHTKPVFTLSNTGSESARGYLYLHLIDLKTGQTLISQHVAVEVPTNAMTVIESDIYFFYYTGDAPPEDMDLQAEVVTTNAPCIACGGSGKVVANSYLLTKSYKNTFINQVRSSSVYGEEDWVVVGGHRVQVGSKEWLDWMELS